MSYIKDPSIQDFSLSKEQETKFSSREIYIRVLGIPLLSFLASWYDNYFPVFSKSFFLLWLVYTVRIGLIWNGCMYSINFLTSRFSIIKEPAKLLVLIVLFLSTVVIFSEFLGEKMLQWIVNIPFSSSRFTDSLLVSFLVTFMISSIYASVGFFYQWKENLMKTKELEKANLEARYETLKSQVNPHFLFNSLNTLVSLVNDNPEASRYVESLSDFMRYVLQTRDKEAVLLRDEVRLVSEYVYIQQSRFGDKLNVELNVPETHYHYAVPPLALQMLIENAIKHNVVSKDQPLHINVWVNGDQF